MPGKYEPSDSQSVTGANVTGANESGVDGREQAPQQEQSPAEGQRQQGNAQMSNESGQQQQFQSGDSGQLGGGSGGPGVRSQLREHMEVIGADGVHVGTIDSIDGDRIKLTKRDSGAGIEGGRHDGHHHYLSLGLVAGIEGDKVRLSANGDVAYGFEEEK